MNRLCEQIELLLEYRMIEKSFGLDTTQIDKDLVWFYSKVDSIIRRGRKINV